MNTSMKEFLRKNLGREIVIRNHVNGFRVSLVDEGGKHISSDVEESVEKAFKMALSYFDENLKTQRLRERQDIENRIAGHHEEIRKLQELMLKK